MFSFHKPRVYRSAEGCCICRAKSSSSRFTDSRKYEDDSMKCFNLDKPRKGEICNACVLLVKRFKRLPVGSNRHWGHVVDARIGPGLKSISKFKKHKDDANLLQQISSDSKTKLQNGNCKISTASSIPEKFCKIFKKTKKKQVLRDKSKRIKEKREGTPASWDEQSLPPTPESFNSDCDEIQYSSNQRQQPQQKQRSQSNLYKIKSKINRRKLKKPKRNSNRMEIANFFDENDWKRLKSCCGIVFENKQVNALIIDIQSYKPCPDHISLLKDSSNINYVQPNNIISSMNTCITSNSDFIRKNQFIDESTKCIREEQTPLPVLKKHHLFLKRQMENFSRVDNHSSANLLKTDLETTNNLNHKLVRQQNDDTININSINTDKNFKLKTIHQIRPDTERIVKHSIDKLNMLCVKQADLHEVKGLVKINDKSLKPKFCAKLKVSEVLCNKNVDPSNTKFSDNSSDSGFDENLLEKKSLSPSGDEDKKLLIQPVQTMFLASGVQICGQQQNLILTGNDVAARMLQQRRQSQIIGTTKAAQTINNGCQKVSAIFNQSTERGGLITLTTTTTGVGGGGAGGSNIIAAAAAAVPSVTNLAQSVTNLNQKIILVKAKYNNNQPSNKN